MKSLLDNGKATSLRYGRANRIVIPSTIYDTTFSSIEETLDSLEYAAEHTDDSQDANLMQALQYYFGN